MKLLHVVTKDTRNNDSVGLGFLERIGYVPCCTEETLKYVLQHYLLKNSIQELYIVEIDSKIIDSEIKWDEWNDSGHIYPHVYGVINADAIISVCPVQNYLLSMGKEVIGVE